MSSPTIECELRTFVTPEQFEELAARFAREFGAAEADEQVTYYFSGHGDPDLRIQKNGSGAKVWMKKGKLHDDAREEIELHVGGADFDTLESLFTALGYEVSIKWFRTRRTFDLGNEMKAMLDHTKGYGHIVELEKLCAPEEREAAMNELRAKFAELGVGISSKEAFGEKYAHYKEHWRELTGEHRQPA